MTQQEWETSTCPATMLEFVTARDVVSAEFCMEGASDRKLRLFACACCRAVWSSLPDPRSRRAVEVAERFADGEAAAEELHDAEADAIRACSGRENSPGFATAWIASEQPLLAAERLRSQTWPAFDRAIGEIQASILREVVGNPFRPAGITVPCGACRGRGGWEDADEGQWVTHRECDGKGALLPGWLTPVVRKLSATVYVHRDFDLLPILADAVTEAGCTDETLLQHLREPGPHVRSCWALDLILGKS